MSERFPLFTALSLSMPLLLVGCGGGGGSFSGSYGGPVATAPEPTGPQAQTTLLTSSVGSLALSVNDTALNPALTGNPRTITLTNTGTETASDLDYSVNPALPSGSTLSSTCSAGLAPGASCTFTVTPGAVASAAPDDTSPVPVILSVGGSNTNTLTVAIQVLTYGSVYQGGYLFAVDDTTVDTSGIGGKVMALTQRTDYWGSMSAHGVSALSTTPCVASEDGACNTSVIAPADSFSAANQCLTSVQAGFSGWYLPAICELGYDTSGTSGSGCGGPSPAQQTIQSSLFDASLGAMSGGFLWSSTEGASATTDVYLHYLDSAMQVAAAKAAQYAFRCVRQITY